MVLALTWNAEQFGKQNSVEHKWTEKVFATFQWASKTEIECSSNPAISN